MKYCFKATFYKAKVASKYFLEVYYSYIGIVFNTCK